MSKSLRIVELTPEKCKCCNGTGINPEKQRVYLGLNPGEVYPLDTLIVRLNMALNSARERFGEHADVVVDIGE